MFNLEQFNKRIEGYIGFRILEAKSTVFSGSRDNQDYSALVIRYRITDGKKEEVITSNVFISREHGSQFYRLANSLNKIGLAKASFNKLEGLKGYAILKYNKNGYPVMDNWDFTYRENYEQVSTNDSINSSIENDEPYHISNPFIENDEGDNEYV